MYRLRFEKEGLVILTADRGKAGIEIAKKEKPNLILLDLVMPEMDGFAVLAELKGDPVTKDIRVVIFSNLGQQEEIQHGLKMGAEDFLIKANLTPSSLVDYVVKKLNVAANGQSDVKGKGQKNAPSVERTNKPICQGIRVLIIENEPAIIDMYKLRLEKEGCTVAVAQNGAWGLKIAKQQPVDIILMDMVMPAMDGLSAIKALKADPNTAETPIVVFSNSAQEQDMKKAVKAGAEAYYIKSDITPATLINKVKEFCKIK